ncbi:hypothetical protein I4U23_021906 [Adineta vaga]|nr:hypothetical protein I4U23_021906 [Adineta vaga]
MKLRNRPGVKLAQEKVLAAKNKSNSSISMVINSTPGDDFIQTGAFSNKTSAPQSMFSSK